MKRHFSLKTNRHAYYTFTVDTSKEDLMHTIDTKWKDLREVFIDTLRITEHLGTYKHRDGTLILEFSNFTHLPFVRTIEWDWEENLEEEGE